jgi:hypothetical protein
MSSALREKIDRLACRMFGHDWEPLAHEDSELDLDLEICVGCGIIEQIDQELVAELTG